MTRSKHTLPLSYTVAAALKYDDLARQISEKGPSVFKYPATKAPEVPGVEPDATFLKRVRQMLHRLNTMGPKAVQQAKLRDLWAEEVTSIKLIQFSTLIY